MDIHQLKVFVNVVDARGFLSAAKKMHLSQSTVSAHIAYGYPCSPREGCPGGKRGGEPSFKNRYFICSVSVYSSESGGCFFGKRKRNTDGSSMS